MEKRRVIQGSYGVLIVWAIILLLLYMPSNIAIWIGIVGITLVVTAGAFSVGYFFED